MATQQPQPPKPRVPLLASVSQRGEVATFDARLINGYAEKLENGEVVAVKRPGINLNTTLVAGGLGIYNWKGDIYAVAGTSLYKNGVSLGTVDITGGAYSFSNCAGSVPRLFLHNAAQGYYYNPAGGLSAAIASLSGGNWGGGAGYLDGTMYIMAVAGGFGANIQGSGINDLATWPADNAIAVQMLPEQGVAMFRQLSYIVALKQNSTEAFFDAGNPTGSPLQSAQGTFMPYGCRSAGSLQVIEDCAIWVTSGGTGAAVMLLENMKPKLISTPPVERLLQQADFTTVYSWSFRINGHRFYALTLVGSNLTLVYDISTQEWYQWTDTSGNSLNFIGSTYTAAGQCLLQHSNGNIYQVEGTYYSDAGASIPFELFTPNWDGGTTTKKYLHRLDILADQAATGTLSIAVSDDDYQTWSNFRQVDLSTLKRALYNCGTFRKRAWRVKYTANTPLRIKALELDVMLGAG